MGMQKKVMIFGTFDGVHEGHRFVFKKAREYGDILLAVVALDETVLTLKGRKPVFNEDIRLKEILEEKVDNAVLGNVQDKYKVLSEHKPDIICLGYDQNSFTDTLRIELDKRGLSHTKVVRLESYKPDIYKSSRINKMKLD